MPAISKTRSPGSNDGMPLLEFRNNVYSQNGEDGIIDAILSKLPALNRWCVEFGAWDGIYLSNTRNLIENREYQAVLIEASKQSFLKLKDNTKNLPVQSLNAFVGFSATDNLDTLLTGTLCPSDFDFLSIDIDGNDIHVWRAIKLYRPKIICIEFNPTIPTEVAFEQPADPRINWGSSLAALVNLGKEKQYELICANECNAFFVVSELFPLFSILDNSPSALRPADSRTLVFVGFDGTLFLTSDIPFPWHGIRFSAEDIQPIPAFLRKYPPNFNLIQRRLLNIYRFVSRVRSFARSRDRLSRATRRVVAAVRGRRRRRIVEQLLKFCTRIVHVGANTGQERELYQSHDLSVIWIEPIPAVYEELVRNIKPYPKQIAIQALLSERAGDAVPFNVASNAGASSSIFDLALHKDIWPEIGYVDQIALRTETLDRVLAEHGGESPIDALILDTQGSELLVLKGAGSVLDRVSFLMVEAADFEAYKGGATVAMIEDYLKAYSFRLVRKVEFVRHSSGGRYYDLIFARSGRLGVRSSVWEKLANETVKTAARRLLGERMAGSIDYYRYPERRSGFGGPFNGQSIRVRIFEAIVARTRPVAIVETGTHVATTTEFFAATGLPVYTIEGNARYYGFARARLWRKANVELRHGDSRAQLRSLFQGPLAKLAAAHLFFYLDAHWNADLPLAEEINIIFDRSPSAVVMIDDFEVPGDSGFAYDDYGPGKALNADYIAPLIEAHDLASFYPATPSQEETGLRRGCVVLCKAALLGAELQAIPLLRRA